MNKAFIVEQIIARLTEELATITAAAKLAYENATDQESKAEGKYDTRALESSYLAAGQARVAAELQESLGLYKTLALRAFGPGEPIALTALVELAQGRDRTLYFVGPRNGGLTVSVDSLEILVVTPQSPLGRTLMGKTAGTTVTQESTGIPRQTRINRVD